MALLSPWFLLGLLAVAGPVIAHLRRLHVQKRVAFSAVEFLDPRPPRSARRSWEDLALLALRIGVLGLLSLAFARPYRTETQSGTNSQEGGRRLIVLLDTSASMRRGTLFEEARKLAVERAASAGASTALEIRTFDRTVRTLLPFEQWEKTPGADRITLLNGALAAVEPGWAVARLDEALQLLAEQHRVGADGGSSEVVVVSDFQEGSSIAGLQGYEWPPRFRITACRVDPRQPAGVVLRWLPPDLDSAPSDAPCRIQVVAPADLQAETVKLQFEGAARTELSVPVVAGKAKVASFPIASPMGRVRVEGFDDPGASTWVARVPQHRALVAVAGGTPIAGDGLPGDKTAAPYFVRKALEALGEARVEQADGATLPTVRDPEVALWVVCSGATKAVQERVAAAVERGATALVLMGEESDVGVLNALVDTSLRAKEKVPEGFVALGTLSREHPVFAPFQGPQFSDFSTIRFWKYRAVEVSQESAVEILARFEGGDPALLEGRRGSGRVLAWTSDWRPADGQWVLSSRCVPFLAACVELATGGRRPLLSGAPGDAFALPAGSTTVRDTVGRALPVSGESVVLDLPGVYSIEPGGAVVVVNLAPEETNAASLPEGSLEALGVPMNKNTVSDAVAPVGKSLGEALALGELEARQGGWRFVLAAVIGLLVVETMWAARITRQRKGTV